MLAVVINPESKAQERQQRFDNFVQRAGFVVPFPADFLKIGGSAVETKSATGATSAIAAGSSQVPSRVVQIEPIDGEKHYGAADTSIRVSQTLGTEKQLEMPSLDRLLTREKRSERNHRLRTMRSKSLEGRSHSGTMEAEDNLVRTSTESGTGTVTEVDAAAERAEKLKSRDTIVPASTSKGNHVSQRETHGSCSSTSGVRSSSPDRESQASPTSAAVSASAARRGGGSGGDEESIAGANADRGSLFLYQTKAHRRRLNGMRKSMSMLESGDTDDEVTEIPKQSARQQKEFAANVLLGTTTIGSIRELARRYPAELSASQLANIQLRSDLRHLFDNNCRPQKRSIKRSPRSRHRRTRSERRNPRQIRESDGTSGRFRESTDGAGSSIAQSEAHLATIGVASLSASISASASAATPKCLMSNANVIASDQLIGSPNISSAKTNKYSSTQCTPPNRTSAQPFSTRTGLHGELHETQSSRDLLRQSITSRTHRRPPLSVSSRQQSVDVQLIGSETTPRARPYPNSYVPPVPPHFSRR